MPNVKFWYLYRDSGNYKKFDFAIFYNLNNISLEELETLIRSKLIDETWFYHKEWQLPDLRGEYFDWDIDPTWHEFDCVEFTDEELNTPLSLVKIITDKKISGLITKTILAQFHYPNTPKIVPP
jgi:hypothetical protein